MNTVFITSGPVSTFILLFTIQRISTDKTQLRFERVNLLDLIMDLGLNEAYMRLRVRNKQCKGENKGADQLHSN